MKTILLAILVLVTGCQQQDRQQLEQQPKQKTYTIWLHSRSGSIVSVWYGCTNYQEINRRYIIATTDEGKKRISQGFRYEIREN